ncbi:MAG TPA: hypothetical protein P5305_04020 [Rubrivivax sp.]|nr:hypothetical protein [Rubrivivax sp.]HRY87029.1 hypothetical protein [Rubrivivax sp.]
MATRLRITRPSLRHCSLPYCVGMTTGIAALLGAWSCLAWVALS